MRVIIDGCARRQVFEHPARLIVAHGAPEVPAALRAVTEAASQGHHVAGWLSYELGYALEPRLRAKMPLLRDGPLLELGVFAAPHEHAPLPEGRAYAGPLQPEWSEKEYAQRFAVARDYIEAGDIYQANLSYRASFAFAGDPWALYERLRVASDAPYCAYVDDGKRQILSISPELFFELSADGAVLSRPMKGTAARSGDDSAGRAALAASAKDRAENLMIVDLIRSDLGRVAQTSSVAVEDLFRVETYPTLHTMVSAVRARLRPGSTAVDLVTALFPCGSVTGAPKIRAMEILRELESSPRGAYCGAIGHISPDGSARFNVAIRTLTIAQGRGLMGVGGGVVHDSRAREEWAECGVKARFFEAGRRPIELIETLRFEAGFVRCQAHLERMAASADVFGLRFEMHTAQEALDRAVAGHGGALRVRLTLDESGRFAATTAPLAARPSHWTYAVSPQRIHSGDLLLRHKTNWRELYEGEGARLGTDEVIFLNERGEVAEGTRSNVFLKRGAVLLTPPESAGLLNGRLRAELLARGQAREATLFPDDLDGELYLGNSLRGLIPATQLPSTLARKARSGES